MVLHDSKFHMQLKDENGAIRSLRRMHVNDLRDEHVGRLSVPGYTALSAAFDVLHGISEDERWQALVGTKERPRLLCISGHKSVHRCDQRFGVQRAGITTGTEGHRMRCGKSIVD
jgi:hypothetical protein